MSQFKPVVLMALLLAFLACTEPHEHTTQHTADDAPAAQGVTDPGQSLYEHNCMTCHGGDGTAGISGAANLQLTGLDSNSIFHTIREGRGSMPAFKSTLSEKETALLTAYIRTLKKR